MITVSFDIYIYMLFYIMYTFFIRSKQEKVEETYALKMYYWWGMFLLFLNFSATFVSLVKNIQ